MKSFIEDIKRLWFVVLIAVMTIVFAVMVYAV
jgi:hypothetical protein